MIEKKKLIERGDCSYILRKQNYYHTFITSLLCCKYVAVSGGVGTAVRFLVIAIVLDNVLSYP